MRETDEKLKIQSTELSNKKSYLNQIDSLLQIIRQKDYRINELENRLSN